MKIASIEAIPVRYPEPNDFDADRHLCLVKMIADDGQVGWGEAITQFPEASLATKAIIDGVAGDLIGRSVLETRAIWNTVKERAWWYGYGGGIASYAVAAIDIASWDLKGRALGISVCELLGGPVHDRLPAIASSHAHHASIPAMAEEAIGWLSSGLKGMKVGFGKRGDANLGFDHDRDVAYVAAMREAIGDDRSLMIDLGIKVRWDVPTAISRVQAFEDYGIAWIEEPLGAWDPDGYRRLQAATHTAIAYGEKEWDLPGYERVLSTGTCDVVGVDPARAEGITGFQLVAERVAAHNRQANAHAWSSAICTAASLAVSFSSTACRLFELKPLRNPMQHELTSEPFQHHDGWMLPPIERPGLGIEIDDDVVERYRVDR